ncbi:MAG: hypothetical protein MZW92_13515 [Comamonadaceae bacterium]|nr:hypothetical protein [Comamonadaceae bacterium]
MKWSETATLPSRKRAAMWTFLLFSAAVGLYLKAAADAHAGPSRATAAADAEACVAHQAADPALAVLIQLHRGVSPAPGCAPRIPCSPAPRGDARGP